MKKIFFLILVIIIFTFFGCKDSDEIDKNSPEYKLKVAKDKLIQVFKERCEVNATVLNLFLEEPLSRNNFKSLLEELKKIKEMDKQLLYIEARDTSNNNIFPDIKKPDLGTSVLEVKKDVTIMNSKVGTVVYYFSTKELN